MWDFSTTVFPVLFMIRFMKCLCPKLYYKKNFMEVFFFGFCKISPNSFYEALLWANVPGCFSSTQEKC